MKVKVLSTAILGWSSVTFIFAVVSLSTTDWAHDSLSSIGLFKYCISERCFSWNGRGKKNFILLSKATLSKKDT